MKLYDSVSIRKNTFIDQQVPFEGWGYVFVFFLLSISQIFLNEQMVQRILTLHRNVVL